MLSLATGSNNSVEQLLSLALFVSAAMTDADIAQVLAATDEAFAVVKNGQ